MVPYAGMAPVTILLNAGSGSGSAADAKRRLETLFTESGRPVEVHLLRNGRRIDQAAEEAMRRGAEAIVAGGGDGTVSAVAGVVAGSGVPMGVLPLGTLNHFAKDLGLPLDLDAAARVVLDGATRRVDVAEVNGRVFVNNSSIGVYPRMVRLRERLRERGRGKWLAMAWAALVVLRRRPFVAVRVKTDEDTVVRRTPFVFVGNNQYNMTGLSAGSRPSIADGRLALYLMNAGERRSLLWLAFQLLRGRGTDQLRELDMLCAAEATIETRRPWWDVAVDGEVVPLRAPLEYRLRPGALTVFAPEPVVEDETTPEAPPAD
jgi:diacylglycerol kinase family enzyme